MLLEKEANNSSIWFLFFCQSMTTLGLMTMVPIMPIYLQQFTGSTLAEAGSWASLAIAAPAFGSLLLAPYLGRACDRYGYRRLVLLSLAGFTVSMLLMAVSETMTVFLIGRLLLGVSGIGVTLTTFASASAPFHQQGRSLALLQAGTACGAFLGPLLGGILQGQWTLQPLLLMTALMSGIGVLGAGLFLKEPRHRGVEIGEAAKPQIAINVVTALWHPSLGGWLLAGCCVQAAAFALVVVFVLFLEPIVDQYIHTKGLWWSYLSLPLAAGLIHALGWLTTSLTSHYWGDANDNGIPRRHFLIGACACGLSLFLISVSDNLWVVLLFRLLHGAFFAALIQTVYLEISSRRHDSSTEGSPGHRIGLCKSYLVLGQIIGPLSIAVFLPHLHPQQLLQIVALLFATAALITFTLTKPHSRIDNTKHTEIGRA